MDSAMIEIYIYMNSYEKIIEWLEKEEGVTTKQQALQHLKPYVRSNMFAVLSTEGGSLAGTAGCIGRVVEHFEKKEKNL